VARSANAKKATETVGLSDEAKRRLREAGALLLLPLALYLLVCLASYNDQDPSWGHVGTVEHARNFGGAVGANIANLLRYIFGLVSYCFPLLLLLLMPLLAGSTGRRGCSAWWADASCWLLWFAGGCCIACCWCAACAAWTSVT